VSRAVAWVRAHQAVIGYLVLAAGVAFGWRALEAEQTARERQSCDRTLEVRAENEQLLVDIATDLGADRDVLATIHRRYDALPPPVDC
jgi:hypothetical protein